VIPEQNINHDNIAHGTPRIKLFFHFSGSNEQMTQNTDSTKQQENYRFFVFLFVKQQKHAKFYTICTF